MLTSYLNIEHISYISYLVYLIYIYTHRDQTRFHFCAKEVQKFGKELRCGSWIMGKLAGKSPRILQRDKHGTLQMLCSMDWFKGKF